ncbi:hypothetical protein NTH44_002821 [Vibrio metoecus]
MNKPMESPLKSLPANNRQPQTTIKPRLGGVFYSHNEDRLKSEGNHKQNPHHPGGATGEKSVVIVMSPSIPQSHTDFKSALNPPKIILFTERSHALQWLT